MRWWPAALFGVAALAIAGCGDDPATRSAASAPSAPAVTSGPAGELAPSQRALPTVPPPTQPERCAPGTIEITAAAGEPPDADVVVTLRNTGDGECEIDVDREWAEAHQIEPSVRLAAGAAAELWGIAGDGCGDAARPVWHLTVNGVDVAVELPAPSCELAPVAFLPV